MNIQKIRGTEDILPGESIKWANLESLIRAICKVYNFEEIKTPTFEATELFIRGVGDATDIVSKEMYTFLDKKGRSLTLRPEGTAGVVRAYIENKFYDESNYKKPAKLFYLGPMFRYERPQKGRYREFHQFGVEVIGSNDPRVDAEVISLVFTLFNFLGLKNIKVKLNTLGDDASRVSYREALKEYFKKHENELCNDCKTRLEKNPLRILDCKIDSEKDLFKNAPKIKEYLNDESNEFFKSVINELEALEIPYELDESLVRGLDYYNHTVFEIHADIEGFGVNTALCGGGRYNSLVKDLGGPDTPAIGCAFGLERLLAALDAEGIDLKGIPGIDLFLIPIGEEAKKVCSILAYQLRTLGIIVDQDYMNRSFKSQLKQADKLNARFVGILGDDELKKKVINIRDNITKKEEQIEIQKIAIYIQKKFYKHNSECDCDDCASQQ
jgi:histidyl-tRNA synthetase